MPGHVKYAPLLPQGIKVAPPIQRQEAQRERYAFYHSSRWRNLRDRFIRQHPRCAQCLRDGRDELSEVVHHLQDRIDFPKLAYKWDNLEALCNACHTAHHKARANRKRGDRR